MQYINSLSIWSQRLVKIYCHCILSHLLFISSLRQHSCLLSRCLGQTNCHSTEKGILSTDVLLHKGCGNLFIVWQDKKVTWRRYSIVWKAKAVQNIIYDRATEINEIKETNTKLSKLPGVRPTSTIAYEVFKYTVNNLSEV